MKPTDEELENISSQLAPLAALGDVVCKNSSPEELAKRKELATWLTRVHAPHEVAMFALTALEAATQAWRAIDLMDAKSQLDGEGGTFKEARHKLEMKIGIWDAKKQARSDVAHRAAIARLKNSPKQAAKLKAYGLWKEWYAGKLVFRTDAKFAEHVMKQWPELSSQKVIEGWITKWRKEARSS